jgi:hypothetical protein
MSLLADRKKVACHTPSVPDRQRTATAIGRLRTASLRLASEAALSYPAGVRVASVFSPISPLAFALALASMGCDERANAGTPAMAVTVAPTVTVDAGAASSASSATPRVPPSSSEAAADKAPLQVLKVAFTSEVKNKEAVDKLDHAEPGQRVWVHLTIRNRGEDVRPISVAFRVNDEQRSKVDLKVEPSWSFRTWAYNTLRAGDVSGDLAVDVRDANGTLITSVHIPIKKP